MFDDDQFDDDQFDDDQDERLYEPKQLTFHIGEEEFFMNSEEVAFIEVATSDDNDNLRSYNMPDSFFVKGIEKEELCENIWSILDKSKIPDIKKQLCSLGMTYSEESLGVGG